MHGLPFICFLTKYDSRVSKIKQCEVLDGDSLTDFSLVYDAAGSFTLLIR